MKMFSVSVITASWCFSMCCNHELMEQVLDLLEMMYTYSVYDIKGSVTSFEKGITTRVV